MATDPAHARKGIATTLLQKAHQHFQERGYRFSFLNTERTIVAYYLYQKLGYRDAMVFPSAYKLIEKAKKVPAEKRTKPNWNRILEIHRQATKDQTGLTIRNLEYMKALGISKTIQPQKTIQTENGYALLKEEGGNLYVREINAVTREETIRLLRKIEEKAKKTIIAKRILNNQILDIYQSNGYMVLKESYDVFMAKLLAKAVTFQEVYGNKFYLSNADSF